MSIDYDRLRELVAEMEQGAAATTRYTWLDLAHELIRLHDVVEGDSVTDLLPPEEYDGETLCAACGIGIKTGRLFATCVDINPKTGKHYSHQETCEQHFAHNPNEEFCDECSEQFGGKTI